jgi:hypothetical protein
MKRLLVVFILLTRTSAMPQEAGTITGQIRSADGQPAAGVRVSAMNVSDSSPGASIILDSIAETDDSGRYLLSGVSPGRYYIVAGAIDNPTFYPGTNTIAGARILTIAPDSRIASMDFVLRETSTPRPDSFIRKVAPAILGKVELENRRPLPALLNLYVDAENGRRRSAFGEDGGTVRGIGTFGASPVSRDGGFRLSLPDGEYTISLVTSLGEPLSAEEGYYVKSISSGSIDLLKQKLRVTGNAVPQVVVITLAAGKP